MKGKDLAIDGPRLVTPVVFSDERGFFMETFRNTWLSELGIDQDVNFVQGNLSMSTKGTLRGLHYQLPPKAQGKLVSVVMGRVWDVVVDIRRSSPTFSQWTAFELSEDNRQSLWVPPGFAHGFYVLSDIAYVSYLTTNYYSPQHERSLNWSDQTVAIEWPLAAQPILSDKDSMAPSLSVVELFP